MNKRFIAATVSAMLLLGLAGCGSDPDAIWYGTVTSAAGENGVSQDITSSMESYGQSVSHKTKIYSASENSLEAVSEQFDKASKTDKAKVVIAEGEDMEVPVYEAQESYHGTKYILFDGVPKEAEGAKDSIRKNTKVIYFNKQDMGYLAGYMLVKEGLRNIAYMSGEENETSQGTWSGFLAGCEKAAVELQLSSDSLMIKHEYAGSDALSPLRMTDALSLYNNGAEIIICDVEAIMPAIVKAADLSEKKAAAIGFAYEGASTNVICSVVPDYNGATETALASAAKNKTFGGGEIHYYGFAENAVKLLTDFSVGFQNVTETSYRTYLETFMNEMPTQSISANAVSSSVLTVQTVQPVTPNAKSGLADDPALAGETTDNNASIDNMIGDSSEDSSSEGDSSDEDSSENDEGGSSDEEDSSDDEEDGSYDDGDDSDYSSEEE